MLSIFFGGEGYRQRALLIASSLSSLQIILEDDESVVPSMSERTGTRSGTAPSAASNVTPVSRQVRNEWSESPQEFLVNSRGSLDPNEAFVLLKIQGD